MNAITRQRVEGNFFHEKRKLHGADALKCADLFAGAGGFSLAAQNVGLDVLFAVENGRHAVRTYSSNLVAQGKPAVFAEDIVNLSPQRISETVNVQPGDVDLILGGPPCQGFSVHRIRGAGVGDPRNTLVLRYFDYINFFRPRAFLMENVPGMLWARHAPYVEEFYQRAEASGYYVHAPLVLDAADFGIPQRRRRVFVLGRRKDSCPSIRWPTCAEGAMPQHDFAKQDERPAMNVFEKPLFKNDPNNVHMNHSQELVDVFKSTPLNGGSRSQSGRVLDCHRNHNGHKDVYGRIDPSKPGPTMTTACINPSKGRFVHPTEHHGITVRHAARFQTFPDSFVFEGGIISAGVQIGNAVPIMLGEMLIRRVAEGLLSDR